MRVWDEDSGALARFRRLGRMSLGLAVAALSLATGGCGTATDEGAGGGVKLTPEAAVLQAAPTWDNPVRATVILADRFVTAGEIQFVVGRAYRMEVRNISAEDRSFVAPRFFRSIALRELVYAADTRRRGQAGFSAEAMEALADRTVETIAAMRLPSFLLALAPENPFDLPAPAADEPIPAEPVEQLLPADPFALAAEPTEQQGPAEPAEQQLPADPFALPAEPANQQVPAPAEQRLPADPFALAAAAADGPIPAEPVEQQGPGEPADQQPPADPLALEAPAGAEIEAPVLAAAPEPAEVAEIADGAGEAAGPQEAAVSMATLAEWTAQAEAFAESGGLEIPGGTSAFLSFVPLKSGIFPVSGGNRFAPRSASDAITVVDPGEAVPLFEAARPAANLALLMAEAQRGLVAPAPEAPAPEVPAPEVPMPAVPAPEVPAAPPAAPNEDP